jgi:hypothetical protein
MAKFYGAIGFSVTQQVSPGVWDDMPVERMYKGDIIRNYRRWDGNENVNDDLNITNSISIIADRFCDENLSAMKYVKWRGTYWKIESVEIQRPRMTLTLGGVYNGPRPQD